jgi:hypothetical protein
MLVAADGGARREGVRVCVGATAAAAGVAVSLAFVVEVEGCVGIEAFVLGSLENERAD